MLIADGHVHIYDPFDLNRFFSSVFLNFYTASKILGIQFYTPVLFIIDRLNAGGFRKLEKLARPSSRAEWQDKQRLYQIENTPEKTVLKVRSSDWPTLLLIAGRKIITSEGLEVLALCSQAEMQDGRPLVDTVELIAKRGAVPVVPWAAGKWLGRRGQVVNHLLDAPVDCLYLSDNGNRPGFWGWPRHFRKAEERGIRIMSGSDPLPISSETDRAGRTGFVVQKKVNLERPAGTICEQLRDRSTVVYRYGVPETPFRFIRNQMFMQIFKKKQGGVG